MKANARDSGRYAETKTLSSEVSEKANASDSGRYAETKTLLGGVSVKANASDSGRYAETKILPSGTAAQGSFKRQIILTFVVGFFFLAAAFSAYQVRTESAYLYRDSIDETISLAESLAASSRSWVLANDVVGLQEVVHSFQGHPGLHYAMVISPSGRVLAHSDATKVGQFLSDEPSLALIKSPPVNRVMIDDDSMIDIAVPIMVDHRHVGWARAGQGRESIVGYLHKMMLGSALFVLMAVVFSLFAALFIANRLGSRIGYLVRVAEEVQAGNYAMRVNISGKDEIARLANSLNHMLDVLARDEEQLRAASLYTRSLIEASLDPLVTISPEGKITDVNMATEEVTGRRRSELIGTDFSDYFTEPDKAREGYQHVFLEGSVTDYPLVLRHSDGHVTDVLYNANVYRNEAGEVMGVFAAARDVTERKRAEAMRMQLAAIVESSNDAIIGKNPEGVIVSWNKSAEAIYGYSANEIIGKPITALAPPSRHAEIHELLEKVRKGGTVVNHESERVRKDGALIQVALTISPIRDASGSITGISTIARDITERKHAEFVLRQSEEGLKEAQRIAHLGSWYLDLTTNQIFWSEELYKMYGFDPALPPPLYTESMKLFTPESWERLSSSIAQAAETGIPYELELETVQKDGGRGWMLARGEQVRDASGAPVRVRGVAMDISERKKADLVLRELNKDFVTLLESTGDYIYFKDKDSRIRFCSQTLANITGHPSWRDMIGKHDLEIFPKDTARIYYEEELPIFREGKTLLNKTDPYYDAQGKPGWVNTNKWPVFGDDGKTVVGIFGISRDITELKEAEDKINELNRDLELRVVERTAQLADANKELEAFSYSVSHDLRTPLRAIDGFSHILLDDYADKLDDEGKRLLNVVRDNTSRMSQLIDDILKFSRTSRLEMTVAEIDMEGMARLVVEELQPVVSAERKLQVEIEHIPSAMGDHSMMHQVFVNLLSNAIKFSSSREIAIIKVGGSIEGNEAVYYVKDNGAGFDMQYADKLFGVFQRLHTMSEFEGTGIGLAIVKRIVTRHGGRVWAEGKINEGATIYFALPVKEKPPC